MESKKIDGGAGVGEQRAGDWVEEEEQCGERWGGAGGGRAVNLRDREWAGRASTLSTQKVLKMCANKCTILIEVIKVMQ